MADRVLFVTSNGTGLGHLTRSMAIARRLPGSLQPLVLTLSAAAPVVDELGFPVEYVASYATPGAGSDWRWSRRLRGRLRAAIAEANPRVLVFDGAHPYQPLLDAMPSGGAMRRIWCRRPLWKPGSNPGALGRERFFHGVLEPGEFAASEDRGPTVARRESAHVVAPVVFCDDDELLAREGAERELGLEPDRVNVLVQLGQGAEVREVAERALRHLSGRPGVQVAALSSTLAGALDAPADVVRLRATYPISRYYGAFDLVVSAAGYNSYHELIRFGVPSLFVPMHRETDDQPARARYAERAGVGLLAGEPGAAPIEELLERMLRAETREAMRARLRELRPENGAVEAAAWIAETAQAAPAAGGSGGRRWPRYVGERLRSAAIAGPRMPLHAAAMVKQTLARPTPRAVVLAFGLGPEELRAGLEQALADCGEAAERVLVVTDSLDFAALRRAGVGFEHVPGPAGPQAALAPGGYEDFVRRRLALILAERPRPRRAVALGAANERFLDAVRAPDTASLHGVGDGTLRYPQG